MSFFLTFHFFCFVFYNQHVSFVDGYYSFHHGFYFCSVLVVVVVRLFVCHHSGGETFDEFHVICACVTSEINYSTSFACIRTT